MIENFGWLIEGRPAGSGCPIHHEELAWLRAQGVEAIVSLTECSLRREKLLLHRLGFIAQRAQQECGFEYARRLRRDGFQR